MGNPDVTRARAIPQRPCPRILEILLISFGNFGNGSDRGSDMVVVMLNLALAADAKNDRREGARSIADSRLAKTSYAGRHVVRLRTGGNHSNDLHKFLCQFFGLAAGGERKNADKEHSLRKDFGGFESEKGKTIRKKFCFCRVKISVI